MQTVTLTERRSVTIEIDPEAARALNRAYPELVEIRPGWEPGTVTITPRGVVGCVPAGGIRWVIQPKFPVGRLTKLIAPHTSHTGSHADSHTPSLTILADLIAGRLIALLAPVVRAGLVSGYSERERMVQQVRGRIDFPRLARVPNPYHELPVVADEFSADVLWNQTVAATVSHWLTAAPLGSACRSELLQAGQPFLPMTAHIPSAHEWDRLAADPRVSSYAELLAWCRMILTGPRPEGGGFIINLETLFQKYVERELSQHLPTGWSVSSPILELNARNADPLRLRPDLVVRDSSGCVRAVWDVKWKAFNRGRPRPADGHQVLSYARITQSRLTGLIYPGARFGRVRYPLPGGGELCVCRVGLDLNQPGGFDRLARASMRTR